jgi:hypothetical protein
MIFVRALRILRGVMRGMMPFIVVVVMVGIFL